MVKHILYHYNISRLYQTFKAWAYYEAPEIELNSKILLRDTGIICAVLVL